MEKYEEIESVEMKLSRAAQWEIAKGHMRAAAGMFAGGIHTKAYSARIEARAKIEEFIRDMDQLFK